jgi:hypothetical protein
MDHEHDALTHGSHWRVDQPTDRTAREVRALLDQLQLLADSPQLRHRLGYGRVSVQPPFADSRRPTDPDDGSRRYVMDNSGRDSDRERNYAAGLL